MYNTNSGNTSYHNGRSNQPTNKGNAPRYRETSRGGRGRDSQKKPTNVWARRNPVPSNSSESEFMSRYGGTDQSADQKQDDTEALANKLQNTNLQDKQAKTNNEQNKSDQQSHTNGVNGEEQTDNRTRKPRGQRDYQRNRQDTKAPKTSTKTTKLSLAEFYSSMNANSPDDNMSDESPSRVLWVGNIGPEVTEDELRAEFAPFGKIESIRILHNRFCAFVNFEEEAAAKQAKEQLHNTIIGSQYIVIHYRQPEHAKSNEGNFVLNQPSTALWIGNVSEQVTEEELRAEFEQYGKIESIRLIRNKTCAFVNFNSIEEASAALHALQGKKLGNMAIKINFGKPPPKPGGQMDIQSAYLSSSQGGYLSEYPAYLPNGMPAIPPMMIPPQYLAMMEPYQYYDQAYDPAMYEAMGYMPPYGYGFIPTYPPMYPAAAAEVPYTVTAAGPAPPTTATNYEMMQ